jgi:hypothetical protein
VVQLHRHLDEIRALGAELVVIGNGAPTFMDGFREATGWDGPLYTDPSLAAYTAAGLARGVGTVLNGRAALAALGALRRGFRQGRTQGDAWQQGGVLVVTPAQEVRYARAAAHAGDHADPAEIVAAVRAAATGA